MRIIGANLRNVTKKPSIASGEKPTNPDQWYNKNPHLFKAEVALMHKYHPNAKLGFLRSTGNMYWIVEVQICEDVKPWTFLLEYMKNHPYVHDYGGSIHVQLLKSPSLDELRLRAVACGRAGVPHIVGGMRDNGERYNYLCTRHPQDVNNGKSNLTTAVEVVGWAADWALHFEMGMRKKDIWNKWCDDTHFNHLIIS